LNALFAHLREPLNLIEEIASCATPAPEVQTRKETTPAEQQPPAPLFSANKIAYSVVDVRKLADVSRSTLYSEIRRPLARRQTWPADIHTGARSERLDFRLANVSVRWI
jgi:hypothetical protein